MAALVLALRGLGAVARTFLAGVALLHDRDWYYQGALQLLALQSRNGSWPAEQRGRQMLDATCFAVLFLKKAALPPTTGG